MEPFNIRVGFGRKEVILTIIPCEGYYIVIYYGGVLGAIRLENDTDYWELVPDNEVKYGNLPLYQHDFNSDRLYFILDDNTVDYIGIEIENTLQDPEEPAV